MSSDESDSDCKCRIVRSGGQSKSLWSPAAVKREYPEGTPDNVAIHAVVAASASGNQTKRTQETLYYRCF